MIKIKNFCLISSLSLLACFQSQALTKREQAALTEVWLPKVTEVKPTPIPSDAINLTDNIDHHWQHSKGQKVKWTVENNQLTVVPGSGSIETKQSFCDMQLHIEWRSPKKTPGKSGQQLGNSGIFIQGQYEIQVLDSYDNETYSNGQAGAVYKQAAPLVNAMLPTGEWQTYDIIFKAPKFSASGQLITKAYVSVLHNGVLIQNHTEIQGATVFVGQPKYHAHGCRPLLLQDHRDEVSYRNIWLRKL